MFSKSTHWFIYSFKYYFVPPSMKGYISQTSWYLKRHNVSGDQLIKLFKIDNFEGQ